MKITPAQAEHFHQHGYVAVADFFNARETRALQAEVQRFKDQGLVRNVSTDGDGKTHSQSAHNLQLIPLEPVSDLLRALPYHDEVLAAITALIGSPVRRHLSQMFLKPGRSGAGTNWHQDNAYFKIADPLKGTAMWIAVHDATVANGTMEVIPDVYNQSFEHQRDPYSDHHIRCFPPEDQAVPIELPAGGVAFFCYGTPHCTRANRTDHDRAGIAYHFLRDDFVPDHYERPRVGGMALLTGAGATDGTAEFGVKVSGTWAAEVERVLARQA